MRTGNLPGALLLGAAVLAAGLTLSGCRDGAKADEKAKNNGVEIGVVVQTVRSEAIFETLTLPGTVEAIEDTTVSAEVAGRLVKLAVTEGRAIRKGELIAEIDAATAKATVNQAARNVEAAEKARESAEAGLIVAGAAVLTAEAGVKEAQATLTRAKRRKESVENLFKTGDATQDERDDAVTEAAVAAARVLQAEARLNSARAGVTSARAAIEQASAAVAVAEANRQLAQIQKDKHTLKSPVNGMVDDLPYDPEEYVRAGTPICRIVRTNKVKVIVNIPERDVRFIQAMLQRYDAAKKADPKKVAARKDEPGSGEVYLRDDQPLVRFKLLASGYQRYGVIDWVATVADPMTRTYETRILMDNPPAVGETNPLIRPGMIATVQIVRQVNRRAVSVPLTAVITRGGRPVIYLYEPEKDDPDVGKAVEETAKFGLMDPRRVQILGLPAGSNVIVEWDIELSADDRVRAKKWLGERPTSRPTSTRATSRGSDAEGGR